MNPTQVDAALCDLQKSRASISGLAAPPRSGVYGIYVRPPARLAHFAGSKDGLVYIGLSTNLAAREFETHFESASTGFSTLRRSIGALLRADLSLQAIPRSHGKAESNVRNYKFDTDGENRLTVWMRQNLEVGVHATSHYEELETALVEHLMPLLNLTKWPNPDRGEIKRLRKVCADEARASRV